MPSASGLCGCSPPDGRDAGRAARAARAGLGSIGDGARPPARGAAAAARAVAAVVENTGASVLGTPSVIGPGAGAGGGGGGTRVSIVTDACVVSARPREAGLRRA